MLKLPVILAAALFTSVAPSPQAPTDGASTEVLLIYGDRKMPMTAQTPEPRSHNFQIAIFVISRDVLAIERPKSSLRIRTRSPSFQLHLPAEIAASEVALVRLKTKDGCREIGADHETASRLRDDDLLPVTLKPVEAVEAATTRQYRVTSTSQLKPGEYALVVRARFYDFAVE